MMLLLPQRRGMTVFVRLAFRSIGCWMLLPGLTMKNLATANCFSSLHDPRLICLLSNTVQYVSLTCPQHQKSSWIHGYQFLAIYALIKTGVMSNVFFSWVLTKYLPYHLPYLSLPYLAWDPYLVAWWERLAEEQHLGGCAEVLQNLLAELRTQTVLTHDLKGTRRHGA